MIKQHLLENVLGNDTYYLLFLFSYPFLFSSHVFYSWEVITTSRLFSKIENMQNEKSKFWEHREASAFMFINAIRPFLYLDIQFLYLYFIC